MTTTESQGKERERTPRNAASPARPHRHLQAWHLQRALGNSGGGILQAKLTIGAPGDRYEQEADRVAEQIVSGVGMHGHVPGLGNAAVAGNAVVPGNAAASGSAAASGNAAVASLPSAFLSDGAGAVRRSCAACSAGAAPCPSCEGEDEKVRRMPMPPPPAITPITQHSAVQRAADTGPGGDIDREQEEEMVQSKESPGVVPAVTTQQEGAIANLRGGGESLSADVRGWIEPRFGRDFGTVRIHRDERAAESARSIGARAYTIGRDVVFGAGEYNPGSMEGKRLLAHELTHVVQQGASSGSASPAHVPGDAAAPRSSHIAPSSAPVTRFAAARDAISSAPASMVQRQAPPAPVCPASITFSHDDPVHTPPCGNQAFRATTNAPTVTWSLTAGPTVVDPGTTIAANGTITIAATQAAGTINAVATEPTSGCNFTRPFRIRANPTGIASTSMSSMAPGSTAGTDYGAVFDHVFTSSDGQVASLADVGVGEQFIGVPTPTAANHAITAPANPFGGTFTLHTATLTPGATNNWFLTAAGGLGGTLDTVTISRAGINVGRFIQSTSNPTPPSTLPATMTLIQGLHWFCPQATAATRWRTPAFVQVAHSRTLQNVAGSVQFVTTVNGVAVPETYTGAVGVFNVTASPVSTPRSPATPPTPAPTPTPPPGGGTAPAAPAANTVRITADTLPSALPAGSPLSFTIQGTALGCTIAADPTNDHAATLTVGTTAGTVTVRVADSTGVNFSDVRIVIT